MKREIRFKKVAVVFALAGILAGSMTFGACGGAGKASSGDAAAPQAAYATTEGAYAEEYGYANEELATDELIAEEDTAEITTEEPESAGASAAAAEQKLIYVCDMHMQTLNYVESVAYIREKTAKYGGIIESESESDSNYNWYMEGARTTGTRSMYLVLRIPTGSYQAFLDDMNGTGKILSRSSSVQNITKQYNDKSVEISALMTQEERLLAMMDQAETIEDMIAIEERLTEAQTQLNKYRSQLEQMDTDVAWSTVNLNIEEVVQYSPVTGPEKTETFVDRLKNTLKWTWNFFFELLEGVLFFLIRMIPVIIIGGVLFLPLRAIWKAIRGRRSKKKEKKQADTEWIKPKGMPENTADTEAKKEQ